MQKDRVGVVSTCMRFFIAFCMVYKESVFVLYNAKLEQILRIRITP